MSAGAWPGTPVLASLPLHIDAARLPPEPPLLPLVLPRCPGAVDESMLTGESRLVAVGEGSLVTGGTLAYEAPINLRATSTGSASTLAGIGRHAVAIRLVFFWGGGARVGSQV